MTFTEFSNGWKHFCACIDFGRSALDADAIKFMNEMPASVAKGLTPDVIDEPCESSNHDLSELADTETPLECLHDPGSSSNGSAGENTGGP